MSKASANRRRPVIEEIEPRILYSAEFSPALLHTALVTPVAEHRIVDGSGEFVAQRAPHHESSFHEVVFVDSATPDYQKLIDDINAQSGAARRLDVVLLDHSGDGIRQISATLATMKDVSAVHLIGHGADGQIELGATTLNFESLLKNSSQIKGWGHALAPGADLLIYGCDVAEHADGRALIDALGRLTGADVAASETLTGAAAKGGDWALEYSIGTIQTALVVSDDERIVWTGLLDAAVQIPSKTAAAGTATGAASQQTAAPASTSPQATSAHPVAAAAANLQASVASVPLAFEQNVGQANAQTDFLARGTGYAVGLAGGDAILAVQDGSSSHVVRLDVLGKNTNTIAAGDGLLAAKTNYLVGAKEQWHTGVANFEAVRYDNVYDGIDLRYYGKEHQLEYDFIVNPGANVSAIRLKFEGVQSLSIANNGDLVLTLDSAGHSISFKAPVAYQNGPNGPQAVTSRYTIGADGTVGFEVGAHDASRQLVIDPVLSYGTYFGGTGDEVANGIAVDSAGNVYLTGYTKSTSLLGGLLGLSGGADVFVAKFSPDLGSLIYSSYVGGAKDDFGTSVTVDASGNAYVTGYTLSTDFPTASAFQSSRSGNQDAFVFKLNAAGSALIYSTYLGGSGNGDIGWGIAVDASGSAYVTGIASTNNFPVTAGAADTVYAGGDAFVTKFNPAGSALAYSTFIGGSGAETGFAIAVDALGSAVVVGETASSNFPTTAGAFQAVYGGGTDAFVTKLNSAGTAFTYSSYLGGNGSDIAYNLALDSAGKIYLTGQTSSNNFALSVNALQTTRSGGADAFVSVIDPSLSGALSLVYSTYLGGNGANEAGLGIGVDAGGRMYVSGQTDSNNFPVTAGAYKVTNVSPTKEDAFLVVIDPLASASGGLIYGTYFGGSKDDFGDNGVYSNGKFYIAGDTQSTSGIATAVGNDRSYGGGGTDAFAAIFSISPSVIATTGTALAYVENDGPRVLDAGFTASDPGIANLSGATIQIAGNYANGEDVLAFTNALGITGTWDAATGTLALVGSSTVANYQAAVRSVTYQNIGENPSTAVRSVTIVVRDIFLSSPPTTRQITVKSVDDAPVNTVPAAQTTNEDTQLVFSSGNQISIGDVDASNSSVQVSLTVTNGRLTLAQTAGLIFITGTGAANTAMTFTGTVANINAALDGLQFDPAANFNGIANLRIVTSDQGNTGSGGPLTTTSNVAITVAAVNDAPVNNLPGPQATPTATPLVFSNAAGNAITVSDVDVGSGALTITLTTSDGTLTLGPTTTGVSFSGNGSSMIVLSGTLASLNQALDGLVFDPLAFIGPASVQISTDDGGNTGSGAPLITTNSLAIFVNSDLPPIVGVTAAPLGYTENDPATAVDAALTVTDPEVGQLLQYAVVRIAANYVTGEDELVFNPLTGIDITGSWIAATGTLTLTSSGPASTAVEYETALRSVTYQNHSDNPSTAVRTVSFVANDGNADGPIASRMIIVAAENDAPVNTVPVAVQSIDEDTGLVFSAANANAISIADPDAGSGTIQVVLSATNGTLSLAQTSGLTGAAGNGTGAMTFTGTIDDINAALNGLRFDAAPNYNGTATIQIATDDQGNSGAGGAQPATASVSVTVAAVDDAPQITPPSPQTTNEGIPLVFSTVSGNAWIVDDVDAGINPLEVTLTVTHGTLALGGIGGLAFSIGSGTGDSTMTFTGMLADINAALDGLTYTPTAFYNGSEVLVVGVDDQGFTGSGGPLSASFSQAITISPVNSAPEGTNTTVTALENGSYIFAVSDFGFRDSNDIPPDNLLGVHITTLPGAGTLTDNGLAVSAGQFVTLADITGGNVHFTPVAGVNGTAYATFTFQVQDDGGTASSGVDLDPSANVMTIDVAGVNVAPAGASNTIITSEDAAYTFAAVDFGFNDSSDTSANALNAVMITTMPGAGTLTDNGVALSTGQLVSAADISGGKLVFTPIANANGAGYASFTFQVQDDGGTLNGGVNLDQSPNTMTVNVTAVNDAPAGTDKTATTLEDTAYTFAAMDFGFGDTADSPSNALSAVKISTIPGVGSLTDNGIAVTAGQLVSAADITAGNLKFNPVANANGTAYASFTFQVQDGGGTANAGVDLDQSPNTMTIDVAAVNDLPVVAINDGVTVGSGNSVIIRPASLDVADTDNTAGQLVFTVSGLPSAGSLRLAGVPLGLHGTFTEADLISGNLSYQSGGATAATDSFVFSVADGAGGTLGPVTFAISINSPPPPAPLPVVAPPALPPTATAPTTPAASPTTPTLPVPSGPKGEPTVEGSTPGGASGSPPGGETVQPVDVAATGEVGATRRGSQQFLSSFVINDVRGRGADPIRVQSAGPGLGGPASGGFGRDSLTPFAQTETLTISASDPAFLNAPEAVKLEVYKSTLANKAWVGRLDHMREAVGGDVAIAHKVVGSTVAISGAMSVGYVIWLLRGGLLLTSLLSSLPAWTVIDPMPVLARSRKSDKDGEDDDPLEKLFGRAKAAVGLGHSAVESAPAASDPVPAAETPAEPNAVAESKAVAVAPA